MTVKNLGGANLKKIAMVLVTILLINSKLTFIAYADPTSGAPTLSSEAAILLDQKTGQVLYDKNSTAQMYPASLTKIATAIYAIEKGNLDDIVTVSSKARNVEGTRVYLAEGEQISLKKLLQGLLINSGNDAGIAIAEHLDGSVRNFSKNINDYLKTEIGVQDTNFVNPHGLFDPNHVTTAEDIARITQYAMKNETFREIMSIKELDWTGEAWSTTLYNHHKLMREIPYEGVTGGKTGYVDQSGQTLVTTAERGNLSLIAVTLKGNTQTEAYNDTIELLDFGFENFKTTQIVKGKKFESEDGVPFLATKNLNYTQMKTGDVKLEVTNEGTLTVVQSNEALNTSFQLKEVKQNTAVASSKASSPDRDQEQIPFTSNISFYFFMLIIVLGVFGMVYTRVLKR